MAGILGGLLWALTPLREPLLGGRSPEHPVFRPYNLALLVIALLLIAGLLALHARFKSSYGRLGTAGVAVIFLGYAMLFVGSIPAVLLPAADARDLIVGGQDLGFLGALVAGVGAILVGIALWRSTTATRVGALLLMVALPIGLLGLTLLSAIGVTDVAGLAFTVPYGVAWVVLGADGTVSEAAEAA